LNPSHAPNRRELPEILASMRSLVRARYELRGVRQGARVRCYGRLVVPHRGGIEIGQRSTFLGGTIPTELRCDEGAEITIGSRTIFNYGVSIAATRSVRIGARCMIASLVHIRDDDGRDVRPVTIGDDVWIAWGAVVEPGSTIGDGAVVVAAAVVSGNVPPRSLATGNPAQYFPLEAPGFTLRPSDPNARRVAAMPPLQLPGARVDRPYRDEVRAAIIEWLDDTRLFGAAADLIADDFQSLRTAGLLDSLGVVQLVLMLEKRFGVSIDRKRAADRDAQSMSAFIDLVTNR
jgi:acetyltransferase-like isoleucine patch superfamily enzyme/acyl carrier protein